MRKSRDIYSISIFFLLIVTISQIAYAQAPDTLWTKTFGGSEDEFGYSVQQTYDGGYIITGRTEFYGAGDYDVWLIKADALGDTVWTKTFGGSDDDRGRSVQQTSDGGYIITGRTESYGAGFSDVWLIRTDATGDTVWTWTFGGSDDDWGQSGQQTSDGGYIITGGTKSYGAGSHDFWLIKTDALGDTIWTKTFGGSEWDSGNSVQQTSDGGYIITGSTESYGAGSYDFWLIKTDSSGDTVWTKTFGGSEFDWGQSGQQTSDGGYIITGRTGSYGAGSNDVWLIRVAPDGEPSADTTFTRITVGDIVNDGGFSSSAAWGDYNGDGNLDLFVSNLEDNFLYANNGDGTFTKVTTGPVVTLGGQSWGASWGDYDNDSDLDLFVANISQNNFHYTNNGDGTFTSVTSGPIITGAEISINGTWGDYDNDGDLDLFVVNQQSGNCLYRNNGDGSFGEIIDSPVVNDVGSSEGGSWGDYNNDGYLDLFVANRYGENNFLYANNSDGTFSKVLSGDIVNDGGRSRGGSWGDYDNDGDLDLFVTNYSEDNFLYANDGAGNFTKITVGVVVSDGGISHGASWGDYDNDGDLDLFVANWEYQNNFLYANNGDGTFERVTFYLVASSDDSSFSGVWGDYDNDGDLDLFVTNWHGENNFLYQNNGNTNSWININAVGTISNSSGIGAKVRVRATIDGASVWQLREISGLTGWGSQNSLNAEFGLGDATIIDSIKIEWPSGLMQVLTDVEVNQFLTITEHLEEGSPYFGTGFSRIRVLDGDPINPDANQEAYVIMGDQITVEVWVYPIGLPIHDEGCDLVLRPFWEGEVRGSYGLHFNWDEGGNLVYAFSLAEDRDDVSGVGYITGPSVEVGTWTHLAGTYNGSSMKLFVNGNLVSEEPYSGIIGEGETGFYIGGFHVQNDEFLHGIIREVRLWDVPRSQGEIQASMYIQLNGEEPGLRGYWPLDQFTEENGIFPVTHDLTPNSNHLNVQGNIFLVDVDIGNEPLIEPWGHGFNGYAVVGEPFFYGSVIDGWPLTWSLVSGPEGLIVDPVTGYIEWTPTANQIGHQSAIIEAWNELGTAQGELWIFVDEFPVDWLEHDNNNILFDVFNNGVLGSIEGGYDYWEDVGNGFHFNGENGLWEGDLIIGLSEDQVSGFIANREFATRSLLTNIQSPYAGFDQAFQAEFDDSRAPDPIGLHVIQRSYSKPTEPDNDYVIIDYELVNMSGNDLNGIYVGLAMDWDVGDYLINAGGYDPERNLSYIYEDQQGSREKPLRDDLLVKGLLMRNVTQNTNFYGVSALGGIVTGHVITINDFYNSDSLLFHSMTNFEIQEGVGDARAHLSVGPFDIPAGGSTQAMFAILGGENLADLQANADAARAVGMGQFVSSISLSLTPDNHFNLTPMEAINLNFSAPIQPVSISSFININSNVYGDFPVDINLINDNNTIFIKPVYSFPLADTISGILKLGLTDTSGYLIDYDGDGVIGDFPIEYYTLLPADYNLDNMVNFDDLVIFRDTWWNKNQIDITPFELHPFQGQLPNVVIIPDNIYAYDDLMTFVYMWNWSHQHNPPVMLASGVSFGTQPIIEQSGSNLLIKLPEFAEAGQIVIQYQGITTDINCATEDGSTDRILLKDKDVESSQLLVEYAYISKSSTKSITLDTKALTRDNSTVTLFYTLYSDNKEIVSQGSQEIELVAVPEHFALHQNYPNPFNPVTTIEYDLPEGGLVKLAIIDILGRQVVQLTNEHQTAGYKSVRWNGQNNSGKSVSTGVYFYLLESGKHSAIRKLVILK